MLKGLALAAVAAIAPLAAPAAAQESDMLIIAHRGASGERPEHTLAAYELAIDQGADYIEPDLVATKDGVLVARHENEISGTTDVAQRPEFASRLITRMIDGQEVTGWFTEDFTLAELRTLRARERLPEIRPLSAKFDGLYQIPTLAEIIALVQAKTRNVGLYPELKHPGYFASIGHDLPAMLVQELHDAGYTRSNEKIFIQSFEVEPLRRLDTMTDLPLVQLMSARGGPADKPGLLYEQMIRPEGLVEIATYADAIGVDMALLLRGREATAALVDTAHEAGLQVHAWTLRKEPVFAPPLVRDEAEENPMRVFAGLIDVLEFVGVDGVFTDNPCEAVRRRERSMDACPTPPVVDLTPYLERVPAD